MEDFDSKAQKRIFVEMKIGSLLKWQNDLKKPLELPGYNGGELTGNERVQQGKRVCA